MTFAAAGRSASMSFATKPKSDPVESGRAHPAASTAILRRMADAGSERSANRPASSRERVGHVLTCNVMGRSGMGVGFQAERR